MIQVGEEEDTTRRKEVVASHPLSHGCPVTPVINQMVDKDVVILRPFIYTSNNQGEIRN